MYEQGYKESVDQELTRRSFDPMASVRRFSDDIRAHGAIFPETRQQVLDEELSYLSEGMDRAVTTRFVMKRMDGNLVYFHGGEWRPYTGLLISGLEVANEEAHRDYRKKFLADRAATDMFHGLQMQKLLPGQEYRWVSCYDYDVEERFGAKFMEDAGMIPSRKMGFIYRAVCVEDGSVVLESQTVDNSDDEAFARVLDMPADISMPELVAAYDQSLSEKHSRAFCAGRDSMQYITNVWNFIKKQDDLINYLLFGIEQLAQDVNTTEKKVKQHIYGVWATFKTRLDRAEQGPTQSVDLIVTRPNLVQYQDQLLPHANPFLLQQEVATAYRNFVGQAKVLLGCGGSIRIIEGEEDIISLSSADVFGLIFGARDVNELGPEQSLPTEVRCVNKDCRQMVATKEVVQKDSWRCPCCGYEVDICTGKIINPGKVERTKAGSTVLKYGLFATIGAAAI